MPSAVKHWLGVAGVELHVPSVPGFEEPPWETGVVGDGTVGGEVLVAGARGTASGQNSRMIVEKVIAR